MGEFSELIKNFDKIRDYMRDFYIYGFKDRSQFTAKSARTYDNEKRRCESYLGSSMKWTYAGGSKVSFVSVDCGRLPVNPLYSAWKSKSFTANDITLHFFILDALRRQGASVDELTSEVSLKSGVVFDAQTVRAKCNEYYAEGLLDRYKKGKAFYYALPSGGFVPDQELLDAVKFFQGGTFGVIGSYILDAADTANNLFVFKHYYIAHTLADGVLGDLLEAMHAGRLVNLIRENTKTGGRIAENNVVPVKILVSARSGRQYLCIYRPGPRRFSSCRIDGIKAVAAAGPAEDYAAIRDAFDRNADKLWGVSFDGGQRNESFALTLKIDEEREAHVLRRLEKEGRGGKLERVGTDLFKFGKEVFDANEALPWIKTFVGRIVAFEATEKLEKKLRADIRSMAAMYGLGEER